MDIAGLPRYPVLAAEVVVERRGESITLRCEHRGMTPERVLDLGPDGSTFADMVLPLLDGARDVQEICRALEEHLDGESVVRALDVLAEEALIVEARPSPGPIGGVRAYRALRAAERAWQDELAKDPQRPSSEEHWLGWYRGWWAENLHFAAGAAKKFALTAARAPAHRELLTAFLVDEHDHAAVFFRKAARALAIDPDAVLRAPPLPEMAALSAFILQACKRQPLVLGWIADQVERAQAFYMRPRPGEPSERGMIRAQLAQRLADYPAFLEFVFAHADVEDAAEHGSYGKVMFERTESIAEADWAEILDLAHAAEWLFARKERAVTAHYGAGAHAPPRAATNDLARLSADAPALRLEGPVRAIVADTLRDLGGRPSWSRLGDDRRRAALADAWAALQREWASAALMTPALALHYDVRFAATCLAVGLCGREKALRSRPAPAPGLEVRSLAAVVAEAAETDVAMALAQTVLLEAVGAGLAGSLRGVLPEDALRPLELRLPDAPATALETLAALGAVGPAQAQAVGVHLQVVGELVAILLEAI